MSNNKTKRKKQQLRKKNKSEKKHKIMEKSKMCKKQDTSKDKSNNIDSATQLSTYKIAIGLALLLTSVCLYTSKLTIYNITLSKHLALLFCAVGVFVISFGFEILLNKEVKDIRIALLCFTVIPYIKLSPIILSQLDKKWKHFFNYYKLDIRKYKETHETIINTVSSEIFQLIFLTAGLFFFILSLMQFAEKAFEVYSSALQKKGTSKETIENFEKLIALLVSIATLIFTILQAIYINMGDHKL